MDIRVCPGILAEGYATYSPAALRRLFGCRAVSHQLDFDFEKDVDRPRILDPKMKRKYTAIVNERLSRFVRTH